MTGDNLDTDFLAEFGMSEAKPQTPEEEFYEYLCSPPAPRIGTIRYYILHEMSKFQFFKEKEIIIQVKSEKSINIPGAQTANTTKPHNKDLDQLGFARYSLEYYLLMHHLPRFKLIERVHKPVCSMGGVIDLLVEHPEIKEVIYKRY